MTRTRAESIFVADAHRGDGQPYVVPDDKKLTAFLEIESAIRAVSPSKRIHRARLAVRCIAWLGLRRNVHVSSYCEFLKGKRAWSLSPLPRRVRPGACRGIAGT
jgi:hypothetical protein